MPSGSITADLSRDVDPAGESPLGQVIADAQLAATSAPDKGGAVIAFTNPGGIRTGLKRSEDGTVTYADLFAAQPFGNNLVTLTLTGAQIKTLLEQQWLEPAQAAPAAGVEGVLLHLGRPQAARRLRARRGHHARRPPDRARLPSIA